MRVSSVILASEDCETAGGIQAIQITQADEVCDEDVTSVTWPSYSDWELNTSRNTIYPEAFGKKKYRARSSGLNLLDWRWGGSLVRCMARLFIRSGVVRTF